MDMRTRARPGRSAFVLAVTVAVTFAILSVSSWTLAVCRGCGTIGSAVDCYNTAVTVLAGGYC
jgi:hypothetical protein